MLHAYEKLVLASLKHGERTLEGVASSSGIGKDSAIRALYWLKDKGAVEISEKSESAFTISKEGRNFLIHGFPEERVLRKAAKDTSIGALDGEEKGIGVPWAKRNGWVDVKEGKLLMTKKGGNALAEKYEFGLLLKKISDGSKPAGAELALAEALAKRGSLQKKEIKEIEARLTEKGRKLAEESAGHGGEEVNVLDSSLIKTGKWKDVRVRSYDLSSPVESARVGKRHPLNRVIEKIRGIFAELGFEEMSGNWVESSFWNFDALFQPQDHPARELADTFYMQEPSRMQLPEKKIVERVKKAHEKGWGYAWGEKNAEKPVLRTHTTAVSARILHEIGEGKRKFPSKFFCIGRTYRNEATDFKHLAEFYQVEGIVVDKKANFSQLLGLLKEFYSKLGFEKIKFYPTYFPYTEPSVEIKAYYKERKAWMELGGAGIFRPEVSIPLCNIYPVLAWGLSLERPLMMMLGMDDIRDFYRNDVEWLRTVKKV